MTEESSKYILDKNEEIVDYLKESRLFGDLPEEILKELVPLSKMATYPAKTDILKEGQQNTEVFFLIRGSVSVFSKGEFIIQLKRIGDIFGEMSVITDHPCAATIISDTPVDLFSITAKEIGQFLNPDAKDLQNILYRFFAFILSEKLMLTTSKARQFETANRQLQQTQKQLQEAHKSAVTANQTKSTFLANISHELKTPLNSILGMTELLFYTDLTRKQRQYSSTVYKAGETLLSVIDDILNFSMIETGETEIENSEFDLKELLRELAETFAPKAQGRGIELAVWYGPELPSRYLGDQVRIHQILTNLLDNAVKFTSQGHVLLHLEISGSSEKKDILLFKIQDTGIGIPKEKLSVIFQEFTQVDDSLTRKYAGTGLGLSICKKLVELMGGKIGVKSEMGKGTTFWFKLPLPRVEKTAEIGGMKPLDDLGNIRFLVVDDKRANKEIVRAYLSNWGIRSSTCDSGKQALSFINQAKEEGEPFEFVLIDSKIPHMSALELGKAIKSDPELENTILLMMSANYDLDYAQLHKVGFVECLSKPVMASDLYNGMINGWKSRGLAFDSAGSGTPPLPKND